MTHDSLTYATSCIKLRVSFWPSAEHYGILRQYYGIPLELLGLPAPPTLQRGSASEADRC